MNPPRTVKLCRFFRVLFQRKVVILGVIIILMLVIMAAFAPFIAPYDPYEQNLTHALEKMSGFESHPLCHST